MWESFESFNLNSTVFKHFLFDPYRKGKGGNVGKWEVGSARVWDSFESFNLNSTVLSITYSILTERGRVGMWESGKVGVRECEKDLSLLI